MNTYANPNSAFPSQTVPDAEKASQEYGRQVAQAIESEWWRQGGNGTRFATTYNRFHSLRLYARGEQPVQKYKDELSINGDMSYLNLDWKPVPVISKFVDIVANGMNNKTYEIKAFAQDPVSLKKRTDYANSILQDMRAKPYLTNMKNTLGIDQFNSDEPDTLPESEDELDLHMQLSYKQSIEIAEEEVINSTLKKNRFDNIKKRFNYDLVTIGVGSCKTHWNKANGVTLHYVDPCDLIYSYTEDPNFEDIYYVGEVKSLTIPEIAKQFPQLTEEELKKIQQTKGHQREQLYGWNGYDQNTCQVLYFEYKTYNEQVFKIKETEQGLEKALEKTDQFNPPPNDGFKRVSRKIEVLYKGVKILGNNQLIEWKLSENMTRPNANVTKVNMNYSICAPRIYKGMIESTVSRITGFADMIQLTHLKLQQVLSRMVPDGVFVDVDGLAEVDLGNGTNYNAQEALNMYFQTGSIVGRSMTQEGDPNRGKVPIQELQTSSGNAKISSLIQTYQYYLQMIRDVTGLNEATDASTPDAHALVGLQKMAAANSNTALRHVMQGGLYLTLRTCENIALRIADALDYPLTRAALIDSISSYNTGTLEELQDRSLMDFGIFLELEPDDEMKAQLEQNIQTALASGGIDLDDAIDIRQVKNIKLANALLKQSRKKKAAKDQANQQANIQAQAQANSQAAQQAIEAEMQKQQALAETTIQIEQAKIQFEINKMLQEAKIKKELMAEEFSYNMKLAQIKSQGDTRKEQEIEDRKDSRIQKQGTQESQLINQRQNNTLPQDFESAGFDGLGGFGLEQFSPR